jgi:hypothetical protein
VTTTGPDLTGAQASVEALMDDECIITRVSPGASDGTEDSVTFVVTEPARQTVYEGRCMLSNRSGQYSLGLPLEPDGTLIRIGDFVQPTSSRRDPDMLGRSFNVSAEPPVKTFAILRRFELAEVERSLPLEGE